MGTAMDFVGRGLQQGGTDIKFASGIGSAWNNYIAAKSSAAQQRMSAFLSDYRAGELEADAKSYAETAGDTYKAGQEAAAIRGLQLAQQVSRIYTGAAGSGLDVSSYTAKHVAAGTRREGYADINTIVRNANSQAQSQLSASVSSKKNAIWAHADAQIQRLNAKYTKKAGKLQMIGGILSSVGNWVGESAQNWSPNS